MILKPVLHKVYSLTIDRSGFREKASRIATLALPFFLFGREIWWWGLSFAALGVLLRSWAAGYIKKDAELSCSGPYLLARHPLYLGSCLIAVGLIIALHHWLVTLVFGAMTIGLYVHQIKHEEMKLIDRFGEKYRDFQKVTGPFWPKYQGLRLLLSGKLSLGLTQFSLATYMKNKEYECLAGVSFVALLLYAQMFLTALKG